VEGKAQFLMSAALYYTKDKAILPNWRTNIQIIWLGGEARESRPGAVPLQLGFSI